MVSPQCQISSRLKNTQIMIEVRDLLSDLSNQLSQFAIPEDGTRSSRLVEIRILQKTRKQTISNGQTQESNLTKTS